MKSHLALLSPTKPYPDPVFSDLLIEYARGNVPLMLPFGMADTFSSTVDFVTLFQTFYHYGRITINQLLVGKI